MPNLVGIGNSQVPTNAMLGGLAYQDPAHANLTSVEIENIAAIKVIDKDRKSNKLLLDEVKKLNQLNKLQTKYLKGIKFIPN